MSWQTSKTDLLLIFFCCFDCFWCVCACVCVLVFVCRCHFLWIGRLTFLECFICWFCNDIWCEYTSWATMTTIGDTQASRKSTKKRLMPLINFDWFYRWCLLFSTNYRNRSPLITIKHNRSTYKSHRIEIFFFLIPLLGINCGANKPDTQFLATIETNVTTRFHCFSFSFLSLRHYFFFLHCQLSVCSWSYALSF